MKQPAIQKPEGLSRVLLHACCAPCSSAIVEWMMANGVTPVIYYFNPNIWPREEYEIRKQESKRHAESLGLQWIDGDYDHQSWLGGVCGLASTLDPEARFQTEMAKEPERGRRCERCFTFRLIAAAQKAQEFGIPYFTTTLASSRWKSLEQIERAGLIAEQTVSQSPLPNQPSPKFWAQNWRKGGLYERRNQLLKEYQFYNQQYCGCEFSVRPKPAEIKENVKNDE
ncbi:MAG: epoxyqueuosine reductase QueH [Prevotella ruminicola]|uniref:Epoxyqueuosine reductase QueH n=1 Tax=Xylanibacter ruminicola TaxID=839 RepID=A0A9D5NYW8_XYLRU|nr:epoxyqueuosine reductase QueH [Xylanibacter ruminicola]